MAFIAQLHGLSYLRLFSKWQKSEYRTPAAFVIKRQNIIKKSHENTHKTSSKKTLKTGALLYGCRSLWSHHKIFHSLSWQLAGGSHLCSWDTRLHDKANKRNISIASVLREQPLNTTMQHCATFLTCKSPGSWHQTLQSCSTLLFTALHK